MKEAVVIGETVDAQLVGRNRGVRHIVTGSHGRIGWVFAVVLSASVQCLFF
jgi:hypothetical protein